MGRAIAWAMALLCAIAATVSRADTDIFNLSNAERQVLGKAISEVLLATPDILRPNAPTVRAGYEAEIASDQALIGKHHALLFANGLPGVGRDEAPLKVALLTSPACESCLRAEVELKDLAKRHDVRVYLVDMTKQPDLGESLGVDTLPFYVLPRIMLRGAMPAAVLDRYLTNRTGQ